MEMSHQQNQKHKHYTLINILKNKFVQIVLQAKISVLQGLKNNG